MENQSANNGLNDSLFLELKDAVNTGLVALVKAEDGRAPSVWAFYLEEDNRCMVKRVHPPGLDQPEPYSTVYAASVVVYRGDTLLAVMSKVEYQLEYGEQL